VDYVLRAVVIGIGATAVMDVWGLARQWLLGIPPADMAFIGRWFGHMARGQFRHAAIAKAAPVRGERALGWLAHYLTGIAFAGLLALTAGPGWLQAPAMAPALTLGVATVLFPFCLMQPAMGQGFAAARTPAPWANRLRSLANHAVFGLGLYCTALVLDWSLQ